MNAVVDNGGGLLGATVNRYCNYGCNEYNNDGICHTEQHRLWTCNGVARTSGVGLTQTPQMRLMMYSSGDWYFDTTVNSSAWANENFAASIVINVPGVRASAMYPEGLPGFSLVQGQADSISSQFANDGTNTKHYKIAGRDSTVPARWGRIMNAPAECTLQVSPNLGQDLVDISVIAGTVAFVAAAAVVGGKAAKNGACWSSDESGSIVMTPKDNGNDSCPP